MPGSAIHFADDAHVGLADEEVHGLGLVDPLLAARGGVDDELVPDGEDGAVLLADGFGDFLDVREFALEVFELFEHSGVPLADFFQVADEFRAEDGEFAAEVFLCVEVFVVRLDAGRGAGDVRDGGGGGDGEDIRIPHALALDFFAHGGPVEPAAAGDIDLHAALALEEVDGVLREEAPVPLGAAVAGVGAALGGEVAGGGVGVEGDGFHEFVVEFDGFRRGEADAALEEGVLEAHDAEADGAVAEVRALGGLGGVEIDVDDIVEGADGDMDGLLEHLVVERAVGLDVGVEDDGAEVADGGFILAGVQRDLGAEVRGVDDAGVVLRAAEVAGVLECDPGVAGLEEHFEHLLPDLDGGDFLAGDFPLAGEFLVVAVAFLELAAVGVVEVGDFVRAEEGPVFAGLHALHEEVGDPVRGVEVVGAAAVVAGVAAELEEVLDVVVPGLEVGAAGAAALAALVDGDELVVVELQERDDALGFAVGALDVAAGAADGRPGAPEAAGPFREVGVFGDAALHDRLDRVVDFVKVAAGELAVERAGIEEGRRAGAEAAGFVEVVEADDPVGFFRAFLDEEAHGDAHPEELRGLEAAGGFLGFVDDEVAVVEGLDAEVVEVHVRGGVDGVGEGVEVVAEEFRREAFDGDAGAEVALEGFAVGFAEAFDAVAGDAPIEDFLVDVGEEDAGCELRKIGVALDEGAGVEDDGVFQDVLGHLAGEGAAEFALDLGGVEVEVEADHGELDPFFEFGAVPEGVLAVPLGDHDERLLEVVRGGLDFGAGVFLALAGAVGAVEDVALGDLEIALAHEFLLDEVLDILDVDEGGFAGADALGDGAGDGGGGLGVFLHVEERAAAGVLDFRFHPRDDGAVAPDEADGHGGGGEVVVRRGFAGADGAFEDKALRDIVGVVFDERLFDEEGEVVLGEAEGAGFFGLLGEA